MRKGILLSLLVLIVSTSFGLYRYNLNCSDGIFYLRGNYFGEGTFFIDNTTFVRCKNQSLYTYFYGPHGTTNIFPIYGFNLSSHASHLFIYLNHTGNFTISNYTFVYNGTHLLTSNFSKPADGLLEIVFENGTFTLLNTTFTYENDTLSTNTFFAFSFSKLSNFTLFNRTTISTPFIWEEDNRTLVLFTYPYNENPENIFFIIFNGYLLTSNLYDDISDGVVFEDCNYNISEHDVYHNLFENYSDFVYLLNYSFGDYLFVFDNSYCDNYHLSSRWNTTISIPNLFDNLTYKVVNGELWFYNRELNDLEKEIFRLFFGLGGIKNYSVKVDSENDMLICNGNVCSNFSFYVGHDFVFELPIQNYTFRNYSFSYNSTMHIFSKYFNLSFTPGMTVDSPSCPWLNISYNNGTADFNSTKNHVECGICIHAEYLNKTEDYCRDIVIDEPYLTINCNETLCNYTIESKSVPYIKVYKNGELIYEKSGSTGQFTGSGDLTVRYGNAAGEKTYALFINSSNNQSSNNQNSTNGTTPNPPPESGNSGSFGHSSFSGYSGSSAGHTSVSSTVAYRNETKNEGIKTRNYTPKIEELNPVVFNITGKYLDVNNDVNAYYILPIVPISLAIFLIVRNLPRIERRIIE